MTAHSMRRTDLRRWNRVQMALMQQLKISAEPAEVMVFGRWFAEEVDRTCRLPGYGDARNWLSGRGSAEDLLDAR
jgi:hypothetical protein